MRILIVAPKSDLQVLAELMAAAGENIPTVLHGTVTSRELLATLRSGNYDLVHFAGHGENMELELSDGQLSAEMVASSLPSTDMPWMVFVNACASLPTAAYLHSAGVGYVIGWRQDGVNDAAAGSFAITFYNTLRLNGGNMHKAFGAALETLHRHYPGVESPILINGRMAVLAQEIDDLKKILARRNTLVEYTGHVIGLIALAVALFSIWNG